MPAKLTTAQKQAIIAYVEQHDPDGEIVQLSPNPTYTGGKVRYNDGCGITVHRHTTTSLKDEEYVRAYLVVRLIHDLRYPPDCIELERQYPYAGRPVRKPRVDVLVHDKRNPGHPRTYLFIEVKAPHKYDADRRLIETQLFKLSRLEETPVKYLVYYTVDVRPDGTIDDQTIVIDRDVFGTYEAWQEAGEEIAAANKIPAEYEIAHRRKYICGGKPDLRADVIREEFKTLRRKFHNVLWGGGQMNYNDVFSNLVKLFLAKIWDEENTSVGKYYEFQIKMVDGYPEDPADLFDRINNLYKRGLQQYLNYSTDELRRTVGIDREKIPEGKVAYVVRELEGISLTRNEHKDEGDLLGEFFEAIVSEGFKQDKGQFFTHVNLVRFIIYGLELDRLAVDLLRYEGRLPYICDPACGSGTFLIEAMRCVTQAVTQDYKEQVSRLSRATRDKVEDWFKPSKPNRWAEDFIYGVEINPDLALATNVNLVLHGNGGEHIFAADGLGRFGHTYLGLDKTRDIRAAPTLLSVEKEHPPRLYKPGLVNEQFDVVISNPPFSITLDRDTLRGIEGRFWYRAGRNSENLFVERWYQLLRLGGRMGVVLPESVFDTAENLPLRIFLYRYFRVKAIVSTLPGL